jgi:hypothetical protein
MRLACIVIRFQPIELFCLGIHFGQTRLHKTHDLGQIQSPLDHDSVLVVQKEMSRNEVKDLNYLRDDFVVKTKQRSIRMSFQIICSQKTQKKSTSASRKLTKISQKWFFICFVYNFDNKLFLLLEMLLESIIKSMRMYF